MSKTLKTLTQAYSLLAGKTNILLWSGSGISVASGLPTFEPGQETAVTDWGIDHFRENAQWRNELWEMLFNTYRNVHRNVTHHSIQELCNNRISAHVTSNIDGLCDGIEICGTTQKIFCDSCGANYEMEDVRILWETNQEMLCECGGLLRPGVVFIGEYFPQLALLEANQAVMNMDALLLLGVSDLIATWWEAAQYAKIENIPIIVINPNPDDTQLEIADLVILEPAENVMVELTQHLLSR